MRISCFLLISLFVFSGCGEISRRMTLLKIDEKLNEGQLEAAKEDIDRYLLENPNDEFAWTILGHIQTERAQDSLAGLAYQKALELNAETVEAITGLGILARRTEDYDKAAGYYRRAIELDPDYAQAYSSLVTIHLKRKKFEEAVEDGRKGYELDKHDPVIAANLSIAYHYYGDTVQRDQFFAIAKEMGYPNEAALEQIFAGELTIFDE